MQYRNWRKIKKAVIYGDSISTQSHGNGGYEKLFGESMGIGEIKNHAISSSGLSESTPDNLVSLLAEKKNLEKDADLIIIWHGSNDWYWGSAIGTLNDHKTDTFLGALYEAIHLLRNETPFANILWLTPLFRYETPYKCMKTGSGYVTPNRKGYTLMHYYEALIRASVELGFSIGDMRRWTNFHEENADFYYEDKVHPNEEGYRKINNILCKYVDMLVF